VNSGAFADISESKFSGNHNGIAGDSQHIELRNSVVQDSRDYGVQLKGDARIVSKSNSYIRNGIAAVKLRQNADFQSSLDIFDGNASGLLINDIDTAGARADISRAEFKNQTSETFDIGYSFNVKLRDSKVLGNQKSAIAIAVTALPQSKFDLGTARDPGGNTLQAVIGGNGGAGICNLSSNTIVASGNVFRTCPVMTAPACSGGVDIVGNVSASCP
jgi:hypothetical protein